MQARFALIVAFAALVGATFTNAQDVEPYALRGSIVTPDHVLRDGLITVEGPQIKEVAGTAEKRGGPREIETGSFIFPGLIDLHDHITWNLFPRWKPGCEFSNRYEWQQKPAYKVALDTPHRKLFENHESACYANEYGEIKAIVGGATSVIGSLGPSPKPEPDNQCIIGLARNLDFNSGFYGRGSLNSEKLRNEVFPLELTAVDASKIQLDLDSGRLTSFIVHLAEGKPSDASSALEFRMLDRQGFLRRGVSIIHGVALGSVQFEQMAAKGVGLIWSPRSNIELYGVTTDVAAARRANVKIALAPDWSPSGSDGVLEELKFAATWNAGQSNAIFSDQDLMNMVTTIPAELAGISDRVGSLKPGMYADLLLIKKGNTNPYEALVHGSVSDVRLVVINGVPIYGDTDLMKRILPGRQLEQLTICGTSKSLYIQPGGKESMKPWKQVSESLSSELATWGTSLAPLAVCDGTNLH